MSDLAAFLRARLDEDEAVAQGAIQGPWRMGSDQGPMHWFGSDGPKQPPDHILFGRSPIRSDAWVQVADLSAAWEGPANGRHIARWDPARVLAEVEAKRAVMADHEYSTEVLNAYGPSAANPQPFGCDRCHDWDGVTMGLGWCATVRALAQPYVDHPDFDPAWRT